MFRCPECKSLHVQRVTSNEDHNVYYEYLCHDCGHWTREYSEEATRGAREAYEDMQHRKQAFEKVTI